MKFLIVSDLHPEHSYMKERIPAMRIAGENRDITFTDIYDFQGNARKLHEMPLSGLETYFQKVGLEEINKKLIEKWLETTFDILVLFSMCNYSLYLLPETILELKKRGKRIIAGFGDDEFTFEHNKYWLPLFDLVIVYTKKEKEKYAEIYNNVVHLPMGFNGADTYPGDEVTELYDVLFIGRPYGPRSKILEYLVENGVNLVLYGSQKWAEFPRLKKHYRGFVSNKDYSREISKARIVLGMMEDRSGKPHISGKLFDAVKCRKFVITSYYEPFVTDYGLQEDIDVVMYHSFEDLLKKIHHYLANEPLRRQIASRMFEKVQKAADYSKTYKALFETLEDKGFLAGLPGLSPDMTIIYFDRFNATLMCNCGIKTVPMPDLCKSPERIIKTNYVLIASKHYEYSKAILLYSGFMKRIEGDLWTFHTLEEQRRYRPSRYMIELATTIISREKCCEIIRRRQFHRKWLWNLRTTQQVNLVPIIFAKGGSRNTRLRKRLIAGLRRWLRS